MKQIAISLMSVLLIVSIGRAQDNAADKPVAAKEPETKADAVTADAQQATPLQDLGWMVGTWVDQGEDATVTTTCSWTHNNKFLTRSFRLTIGDDVSLAGTQMVGWDPIANEIRSWTFDSEGGFGEGKWIQDGNRWLVKTSFTLATGERASALNVFTYVDQDTLRWQSTSREVGGELLPNIPEVTVVRVKSEEGTSAAGEKEVSK